MTQRLFFNQIHNTDMHGTIDELHQEFGLLQHIIANIKEGTDEYYMTIAQIREMKRVLENREGEIDKNTLMLCASEQCAADFLQNHISLASLMPSLSHTASQAKTKRQHDFRKVNQQEQILKVYALETEISMVQKRIKGIEERAEF